MPPSATPSRPKATALGGRLRIDTAAAEQAWNDAALASAASWPRLAYWAYSEPAIVLGAGQRQYPGAARKLGIPVARRCTGGTAVFTGPWLLTTSLVLPPSHEIARRGSASVFDLVAGVHVAALSRLGVRCLRAEHAASMVNYPGADWACFGSTGLKEIVGEDGRKLAGLAQARRTTGTLVVAGLLLEDPDWQTFASAMSATAIDAHSLSERTTSCARLLGHELQAHRVAGEIDGQFARLLGEGVGAFP